MTISFAGDIHFEAQLAKVARDPQGLASLNAFFSKADIAVANLETSISDGPGAPQPGKPFTFRAPSSALTTLANAGIDVVSMANNHGADWNSPGVLDSLRAKASAPLKVIGIGKDAAEANAPATFVVDGVSVAIFAANQTSDETIWHHTASATKPGVAVINNSQAAARDRFVAAMKEASARYDVVIAFLHYGNEGQECPTSAQFAAVPLMANAGADAVVGGHSHRVQAGGWTKGTYVSYGLGNFVWWKNGNPASGILTVSIDKDAVRAKRALPPGARAATPVVSAQAWTPMQVASSGIPSAPSAAVGAKMTAKRDSLLGCSKLSKTP